MRIFSYHAIKPDGQHIRSSIEAEDIADAKRRIRDMHVIILSLQEDLASKKAQPYQMTFDQKVIFMNELAQLLAASIPLYEALTALETQAIDEPYQPLISALREHIRKGLSLSDAMKAFPHIFSQLFCAIVASGESIGKLDTAILQISQILATERQSRQRIISALLYPSLLLGLLGVVIIVMIFFVIPSMQKLLEDQPLPTFTTCIFGISSFINAHIYLLGVIVSGLFFALWTQIKNPAVHLSLQRHILSWPILGNFIIKAALGRFAHTLSTLLQGGITLSSALEYARESLQNATLEEAMRQTLQDIIDGQQFSAALSKSPFIPKLFTTVVAIGEETGRLTHILANIATMYEEDSQRILDRAVNLLQPLVLLTIGLVIGATLLAILLPLASFSSTIGMQ